MSDILDNDNPENNFYLAIETGLNKLLNICITILCWFIIIFFLLCILFQVKIKIIYSTEYLDYLF